MYTVSGSKYYLFDNLYDVVVMMLVYVVVAVLVLNIACWVW